MKYNISTLNFPHTGLLLTWKAGVRSEPVPDQTCPMSSPCPLKKTKGRMLTPSTVSSMPAVALSSSSGGGAASPSSELMKLLRPPANMPSCVEVKG